MRRRLLFFIFVVISSCGEHDFPRYREEQEVVIDAGPDYQYFSARLRPLNRHLSPLTNGESLFWFKEEQFYAKLVFWGNAPGLRVQPFIHSGSRCPDRTSDLNGDGIIDPSELRLVSGDILFPLDRVLRSREEGNEWFPIADDRGDFVYSRAAKLTLLLSDLQIGSLDEFAFGTRTLVIYGARSNPFLPVACAKIYPD